MYKIDDEHQMIKDLIKEKSLLLKDHEKKGCCLAVVPIQNYIKLKIGNRLFYLIPNNVFDVIIHKNLILAQKKYPERFGNGNAKDVVHALYDIEPWMDFDYYINMLSREQFCYVVEIIGHKINPKVLRLDLYRKIEANKEGGYDFVGGIFHCFKHFRFNGIPLSTGKDNNELRHPTVLITKIIEAFFIHPLEEKSESVLMSEVKTDEAYNLRFVFYYEKKTKVYFIKTSYLKNSKT